MTKTGTRQKRLGTTDVEYFKVMIKGFKKQSQNFFGLKNSGFWFWQSLTDDYSQTTTAASSEVKLYEQILRQTFGKQVK